MKVPPPRIKQRPSLLFGDTRLAGPGISTKKCPWIQEKKHFLAVNTEIRSAESSKKEGVLGENCNDLLCQLMVNASTGSTKEKAIELLDFNSMFKEESLKHR